MSFVQNPAQLVEGANLISNSGNTLPAAPAIPWAETSAGLVRNAQLASIQQLHQEMGRIASITLPGRVVDSVLKRTGWEYETTWTDQGRLGVLRRELMDNTVELILPEQEDPALQARRDEKGLTLQVPNVTGGVLQQLLDIEKQLVEITIQRESSRWKSPKARAFQEAKRVFTHEDSLFTDRESLVLAEMTHGNSLERISEILGTSGATLSREVKPARERVGADTNIHLMLIAIAAGIADISHIPKGMTESLNKKDLALLSQYYDPDPEIRASIPGGNQHTRWSRMYDKLGIDRADTGDRRWLAVLYGVQDGVVELPDVTTLKINPDIQSC